MTEQWQELKETITELRDNDGTGTQQEVCKFLTNYMDVLEKQMQEPCEDLDFVQPHKKVSVNLEVRKMREATQEERDGIEQYIDSIAEPCEDCISRNAIIKTLNKMDRYVADELTLCDTERKFPKNEVFIVDDVYEEIVEQLPSVNPQEPKTGHWILADEQNKEDVENDNYRFICSECQCSDIHAKGAKVPYCWKCGAKMEG